MCLPEVILEGIVLVYGCIGVRTQVKVYSFTDAPIHLYIGTLHSCITYGYMKLVMYRISTEDVPTRGNTRGYCISIWMYRCAYTGESLLIHRCTYTLVYWNFTLMYYLWLYETWMYRISTEDVPTRGNTRWYCISV